MSSLRQALHTLTVATKGRGFTDATAQLTAWLHGVEAKDGLLTVFIRHTSASLVVQENADPSVRTDLETAFARLAPDGDPAFEHDAEGPDDMPAHVRTMLTGVSLHVPVVAGSAALGTWQGIYVVEHRARPHRREVVLQFIGSRR